MPRYSLLDLVPICQGSDARQALRQALDLAQHAERWGYERYWVAEHHNIPGIASAATAVVIAHLAGGTSRLRIGSGGIMLPNHAPLVIAEQFGTLEAIFPGRIDLGLGRAPGGDQYTARALRRTLAGGGGDSFPQDVAELNSYLQPDSGQPVKAIPGTGSRVPLYLLGSSDFSARLAAELGLPFAFASHFAPGYIAVALDLYRRHFRPSAAWREPYVMIGVNVFAAETDGAARRLFSSLQQAFLGMLRGTRSELRPPVDDIDALWSPEEATHIDRMLRFSAVGGPDTVRAQLETLIENTGADEVLATAQIYDHQARLRSFEIAAGVLAGMGAPVAAG